MTRSTFRDVRLADSLAINGGSPLADRPVPFVDVQLAEADIAAAVDVLRSGRLAQGPAVEAFERRFAALTGAEHAVACANGTCALQLTIEPMIEPGDDVLVPAWSFIATASMVVARGARPVFCDADPRTYCLDVQDASRRATDRTTAIIATHLYGNPADIDAIEQLAERRHLRVIYDAAQSHGAKWRGRGVGAFGDACTYSFYPTKNMTTGEGGMVTTNDAALAQRLRLLRNHGQSGRYLHATIGYNYRMSELEGAIGLSQLERLEQNTRRRRDAAAKLDAIISEIAGVEPTTPTTGGEHVYHLYAARLALDAFTVDRDRFVEALRAEGVDTAVHYPRPLTRQPALARFATEPTPVSDRLAETLFCLPIRPTLSDEEVQVIGEALRKVAEAFRV